MIRDSKKSVPFLKTHIGVPTITAPTIAVKILNKATLRASFPVPMHASKPVTQVPIVAPMLKKIACEISSVPDINKVINKPFVAEEDWIIPVNSAPIVIKSKGRSMV